MSSHVLVLNAGSSSLKYALVDASGDEPRPALASGLVERIGETAGHARHSGPAGTASVDTAAATHEEALRLALAAFAEHGPHLDEVGVAAIGHRLVHGGDRFAAPVLVDDALVAAMTELVPLAPLHNPANLEGVAVARRLFPELPQVGVFDTAFHQTLPPHAATYAVPRAWTEDHGIRRYGFHGTSVSFVSREAACFLGRAPDDCRLVVLHLGNGASATAVDGGRSVDTSMGFTPLEGLVMGTRSGDLDPGILSHLQRHLGMAVEDVDRALNRESGVRGLVGTNDMREVVRLRGAGDARATLAFDVYCHRLRKYVGAYYAVLGSLDAVVFTGGVGEHSPLVRSATLTGLDRLGIAVDPTRNETRNARTGPTDVATDEADVRVLVIPTNEEWEIARQALELLGH